MSNAATRIKSTRNILRNTSAEVSSPLNISDNMERKYPNLSYEGAAEEYEDMADYYPKGSTLRCTVLG